MLWSHPGLVTEIFFLQKKSVSKLQLVLNTAKAIFSLGYPKAKCKTKGQSSHSPELSIRLKIPAEGRDGLHLKHKVGFKQYTFDSD